MEMEEVGTQSKASSSGSSSWRRNADRYLTGIGLLLIVVVLWTSSNFLTAALEAGSSSYDKPFLITYLNTSTFTLYLLPSLLRYRRRPAQDPAYQPIATEDDAPMHGSPTTTRREVDQSPRTVNTALPTPLDKLTVRETAIVSAWWSIGWFLANFTITLSLAWTSVASATILSSTSGFFTLALGSMFAVERFTRWNISAVVLSFLGVILVTRSDSSLQPVEDDTSSPGSLPTHPVWGDLAAILSAACYGGYVVLLKVKLGHEDRADPMLMLGFAGLYQTTALIPVFFILHWTGLERFQLPPDSSAWLICLANMCITFTSDYLYILAMLKTSPMLVTVGLSLTIPLALVVSIFIPSLSSGAITLTSLVGAGMVLGAFLLLSWTGKSEAVEGGHDPAAVEDMTA